MNISNLLNKKIKADGKELLAEIPDESIAVVFFDPQYKGILDKLHYGQHRMNKRYALQQMDEKTIASFIQEINRILKKSGHLFLWIDKFHLINDVENFYNWLKNTDFTVVDMIVWNKGKIGMGYRTRRKSEYLLVLQKKPTKAKGIWTDHSIPDIWEEKAEKNHAHAKPIELQRKLISATTKKGDIVVDPASGGYSVFDACKLAGIDFLGCDIEYGEHCFL